MDVHLKTGNLKLFISPNLGFETSQTWDLKLAIFWIGMQKCPFYGKILS